MKMPLMNIINHICGSRGLSSGKINCHSNSTALKYCHSERMSLSQQETGLDIGGELFFVESETSDQSNAILNCSAVATGHFSLYEHCSVYF